MSDPLHLGAEPCQLYVPVSMKRYTSRCATGRGVGFLSRRRLLLDELLQIALHLLQVGQIEVHHVAGLVFGVSKVAAIRRVQLEVFDAVMEALDRAGEV